MENIPEIIWNYRGNMSQATLIERSNGLSDAEYYVYDSEGVRLRKVLEQYNVASDGTVAYEKVTEKRYLDGYEIKRISVENTLSSSMVPALERFSVHLMDDKKCVTIMNRWTLDANNLETESTTLPQTRYQFEDNRGSCTLELDSQEAIISYEEYYPFGGTSFIAGNSQVEVSIKDYRYSGKECDDTTALLFRSKVLCIMDCTVVEL